jgi:hypothetical protein
MVFYDLTSTYFEGEGPPELGANSHSRDGKPRNRQVGQRRDSSPPLAETLAARQGRSA